MQHYVVQMRDRGVVTLPKDVRERYGLAAATPLTLIDGDGVLVLSSRVPVVTELARQLAAERAVAGVTVEDLLTAWAEERYGPEGRPSTDDA